jgi:hypothetical protein
MAELRATPYANPLTGLSNDAIQGLLAFMQDKRRTQQLQGLGNLLESTGIPKTVERAAYAESPRGLLDALTNVNRANVPLLKPETAEAAMTLAPFATPVNRALMQATKGLPVGASIKNVGQELIYHGTSPKAAKAIEKSGFDVAKSADGTIWFTNNPNIGEVAATGKGAVVKRFLDEKKMKLGGWDDTDKFSTDELIQKGFDGLKLEDKKTGEITYQIFNPEKLAVNKSYSYPQQEALDTAQRNAALPIEKGGLGLPKDNTPEMRAEALGVATDAYHGSKQDITGLFKAGYDDNLAFATQDPEFASKWIGKGKLNQRIGAEDDIKAAEDVYRQIKYKNTDNELLSKLEGEEFNTAYDKMSAAARAENEKEFGTRGNATGLFDTVYPLKIQANKTFNPETDMDVMKDFFVANDIPPKLQELYAGGNYMMYETKPVVSYLKSKGYDSMRLRESTGDNYPTIAVFNPETVRSRFAAFDPFRKDTETAVARGVAPPDLLAGLLPLGLLDEEKRKEITSLLE